MKISTALFIASVLSFYSLDSKAQDATNYPADAVINVVTNYRLDNTGTIDVTDTLNAIIAHLYNTPYTLGMGVLSSVLYFPNGTNRISSTINWYNAGAHTEGLSLKGESRDSGRCTIGMEYSDSFSLRE